MSEAAKRVRVTGRVQGVSFRAWTQARAEELGLRGWVMNEPDGSVAALVAGSLENVQQILTDLRAGPPAAEVSSVEVEDASAPAGPGFEIRG